MNFFLDLLSFAFSRLGFRGLTLLANLIGVFLFDVLRIRRDVVLENLNIAFGAEKTLSEKITIGRASVCNFVYVCLESFCSRYLYPKIKVEAIKAHHLEGILAHPTGVYLASIHLSNFEFLGSYISLKFKPLTVIVKNVGSKSINDWVQAQRLKCGVQVITPDSKLRTKDALRVIARKDVLGFMVDQRRKKGVLVPLFGRPALTNSGLFFLWALSPAPIVPVTLHRIGYGHYRIVFYDELKPMKLAGESNDDFLKRESAAMNQSVESMIRACPEEYFWMHKRWKL